MKPQDRARHLRPLIVKASEFLDDSDALDAVELFDKWKVGMECVASTRYSYGEDLYRCEQTHTTQADWTPDISPSLFTKVTKPGEIPVWKQPTGAQDAYQKGDRVWYPDKNGHIYESIYDGQNSWSPDAYPQGWLLIE